MSIRRIRQIEKSELVEKALFTISAVFLFARAPYGWCFNDEPFLVTLAQRLYMGDSLIFDEWNPGQIVGPLLLPFYSLFHMFSEDNVGILLAFRYIYCFLWLATCLFVTRTIKNKTGYKTVGSFIFLFLALFAPLDNMTLSYTSFGLMSCLILCSVLICSDNMRIHWRVYSLILSVLICILTLCTPHMAMLYAIVFSSSAYMLLFKRNNLSGRALYLIKSVVFSGIYIGVFAIIYLYCFAFRDNGFSELEQSIAMIFMKPDFVTQASFFGRLEQCLRSIFQKSYVYSICIIFSILFCIIFQGQIQKFRLALFTLCVAGYLWAQFWNLTDEMYVKFNYQMIDIGLLGFAVFPLLDQKPWELFYSFSCIGGFYSILRYLGTDTGLYSIGMTLTVCGVSGIVCIIQLSLELSEQYRLRSSMKQCAIILCVITLVVQLSGEVFTKLFRQYWDEEPSALTAVIEVGAAKGLRTVPERKVEYELNYTRQDDLLEHVDKNSSDIGFVSFSSAPVIYLDANLPFGTFSSWTFPYKDNLWSILKSYEEINPDARQTVFFTQIEKDIPEDFSGENYTCFVEESSILFVSPSVLRESVCEDNGISWADSEKENPFDG